MLAIETIGMDACNDIVIKKRTKSETLEQAGRPNKTNKFKTKAKEKWKTKKITNQDESCGAAWLKNSHKQSYVNSAINRVDYLISSQFLSLEMLEGTLDGVSVQMLLLLSN